MALPDDKSEEAEALISKVESHLNDADDAHLMLQQQVVKLQTRVSELDGLLAKAKKENHANQISHTKDNILVRTTKDAKSVCDYITQMVNKGGAKTNGTVFTAHPISSSSGDPVKSPKKFPLSQLAPRGASTSVLYKVHMGPVYKDALFKGLASGPIQTRANANLDFSISHDTPLFLRKTRVILEQCAYSIRKSLKEKLDIRTKVVLKDQNLRLCYNTKESRNWVHAISSDAGSEIHQEVMATMYQPTKEGDARGDKTVAEVIASLTPST